MMYSTPSMEKTMKGMIGVYQICSRRLGKSFVGASLSMGNRFRREFTLLFSGQHPNPILQRLCNENGIDDLYFIVLEVLRSKEELVDRESYWMKKIHASPLDPSPYRNRRLHCSSRTGGLSLSRSLREELKGLRLGTMDETIRSLVDSYR